jgi:hypothetical protein
MGARLAKYTPIRNKRLQLPQVPEVAGMDLNEEAGEDENGFYKDTIKMDFEHRIYLGKIYNYVHSLSKWRVNRTVLCIYCSQFRKQ